MLQNGLARAEEELCTGPQNNVKNRFSDRIKGLGKLDFWIHLFNSGLCWSGPVQTLVHGMHKHSLLPSLHRNDFKRDQSNQTFWIFDFR